VRLESFCRFAMRYLEASWHRPYDHVGEDGEAIGFGHGDGSVSGEIEGTIVWANYPRRHQDGVWTPNLRGKVALDEGGEVLVSIHGQSVQETGPTPRRAILARAELTTEASPVSLAEHVLPRRRGRDRRGARELVARHLCLRERPGAGPAGARRRATDAIPTARPTGGRLVIGRAASVGLRRRRLVEKPPHHSRPTAPPPPQGVIVPTPPAERARRTARDSGR
jgi:hypothetical protein